jgi:hypothetical protein
MTYVDDYLRNLPSGLERATLRSLSFRVGEEQAILRNELVKTISAYPGLSEVSDRQVRKAIEILRHRGIRICNLQDGDGYFIAATEDEYQRFKAHYGARARTIFSVIRAMDEKRQVEIVDGELIEPEPPVVQMNLI